MAKRGTVKAHSVIHEDFVALKYGGKRSASSGGADHDAGDVRAPKDLIECKYTGSSGKPLKAKPTLLKHFEKVAEEAFMEGRSPVVALRYYWPDSFLADANGWVDLAVRQLEEDAYRGIEIP